MRVTPPFFSSIRAKTKMYIYKKPLGGPLILEHSLNRNSRDHYSSSRCLCKPRAPRGENPRLAQK